MATTLGLPGSWAADSDPVDAFASRVGGDLAVPAAARAALVSQDLLCNVCTSQLQLLSQVHAPCGEDQVGRSVQDRILLLLGCTAPRCGTAAGSWRAFRLQSESQPAPSDNAEEHGVARPDLSQQHAASPSAAQPPDSGVSNAAAGAASSSGAFSFGATSFGFHSPGNPGEHGASCDPMSFADLDLALTTISSAGSTPAAAKERRQPSAGSTPATTAAADERSDVPGAAVSALRLQRGPSLPGFHIIWQHEPEAAPDELRPADAAHVASLVDQYEADHEMADLAGEGWTGEAYEADTLPGGDSSFPKFSKRLQRAPEQCIRYSFGGHVLWPRPQPPQPPPCSACGAARLFELQAMPAMHTALGEGLQWLQSASPSGDDGSSSELSIDAWSWLTVAVFTCSKSCSTGTGYSVVEEHVVLADE